MNPFETVTGGGILVILAIVVLGAIIFLLYRVLRGYGLPQFNIKEINQLSVKPKSKDNDLALCFNIYPDKYVCESMLAKSISPGARLWRFGNKPRYFQMYKDKKYLPVYMTDVISFEPGKLARMLGCKDYKELLSIQFSLLENLAPFAPVIALIIAAILFIIMVG